MLCYTYVYSIKLSLNVIAASLVSVTAQYRGHIVMEEAANVVDELRETSVTFHGVYKGNVMLRGKLGVVQLFHSVVA